MTDIDSNSVNICNMDITDEINQRILARNITSGNLDMVCSLRPVATKYTLPTTSNKYYTINNNPSLNINDIKNTSFDVGTCFNPGNTKGPWSGYVTKVNDESVLRNQIYALQKSPQSEYIPNSNSDLYNYSTPKNNNSNVDQLFPNLFNNSIDQLNGENGEKGENTNNLGNIGKNVFNNHTRQQLKDN